MQAWHNHKQSRRLDGVDSGVNSGAQIGSKGQSGRSECVNEMMCDPSEWPLHMVVHFGLSESLGGPKRQSSERKQSQQGKEDESRQEASEWEGSDREQPAQEQEEQGHSRNQCTGM